MNATRRARIPERELPRSRFVAIIDTASNLSSLAIELLKQQMPPKKAIHLPGIPVSGFRLHRVQT
jgi:hypothetical protein